MILRSLHGTVAVIMISLIAQAALGGETAPEDHDPLKIIRDGCEEYEKSGIEEALKTWLKGSILEDSQHSAQLKNYFLQMEHKSGPYRDFEVLKVKSIGNSTKIIFFALHYEKSPLFVRMDLFRSENAWVATRFTFNVDMDKVLPSWIMKDF